MRILSLHPRRSSATDDQAARNHAGRHLGWRFVYPVHLNPNMRGSLGDLPFVWQMDSADVILRNSGGIQKEGPSPGKPVLVMRTVIERPEAVEAGIVMLVGTDQERIINGIEPVLLDRAVHDRRTRACSPYSDGPAAEWIVGARCDRAREGAAASMEQIARCCPAARGAR